MDINARDITAAAAAKAACLSPVGSPEYWLACQICLLRGENPDAFAHLFGEGAPLIANWQRVIALQTLESLLRISLRNGPTAPAIMPAGNGGIVA